MAFGGLTAVDAIQKLRAACEATAQDDRVRVVVVTIEAATPPASGEAVAALIDIADSLRWLSGLAIPSIAAVHDDATGIAVEVALACDVRICAASTKWLFEAPNPIPLAGGMQRLTRLVGRGRALDAVLWGESIDAATAYQWGLVNRVVPDGQALETARDVARTIASRGPLGVRYTKEAIVRGIELPLEHGLKLETDLATLLQATADRAEGVRAFIEKRPPEFTGE